MSAGVAERGTTVVSGECACAQAHSPSATEGGVVDTSGTELEAARPPCEPVKLRCEGAYGKVSRVDETQIPADAAFRIQLPTFEGPLDLLLHLVKKHDLDILDLPIAFVTERYLDYLQMMQELDLDIASEYLLMAATLAHIKSKMLLPQNPLEEAEEHEEAYLEDPRAELIRRLLEYQKYRAAAEQLGARPIAGRDVFGRGLKTEEAQGPAPLAPIDLYKLLDAFGSILKRVKGRVALEVTAERITIHERITEITDLLRARRSCLFEDLFATDRTRYEVVVTFLALLEMTKLRMTRIYQADPKSPLHVQYALLDENAAIPSEAELSADAQPVVELETLAADGGEPVEELADETELEQQDDDFVESEVEETELEEPDLAESELEETELTEREFAEPEREEADLEEPELIEHEHEFAAPEEAELAAAEHEHEHEYEQELTAPEPEPVLAAPAEPELAAAEPELAASEPDLTAPEPELAAAEPAQLTAAAEPEQLTAAEPEPELAAPEAALATPELEQPAPAPDLAPEPVEAAEASDDATLDAQAWDDLNAALEPAEPVDAAPAAPEGGFDDDAPTLTNLAPAEPEQTTPDADPNDDNRETSA